jgi:predicted nucleic acid-binding protein
MVIVDTGFWLALSDDQDKYYQNAKNFLRNNSDPLITSWPVITETCHLLQSRKGTHTNIKFMKAMCNGASQIFDLEADFLPRITALLEQYADLPMDLADASLVVLAEHLGHGRIVSTDQRDFGIYRWKNTHPFENLLI